MKKKILALLLTGILCASLSACSGEGGSASSSGGTAEAASAAETESAAGSEESQGAADSEAEGSGTAETESASGGHYVIATDTAFRPFEYTNADGELEGIDVDLLAAIAEDQGFTYELQALGWDAAIAACQAGQADGMIAGASITDERKESGWIFSDGYFDATQCFAVSVDSEIASFEDTAGTTVAVKTGTLGASYAESLADTYDFTISYFEDSPTMYQAVLGGQCSGCFDDTSIMKAYIQEDGLGLKTLDDTQNEGAPYGFAVFSEDKQELIDMFNAGLANIRADGTYDEIIAKYLGE